jgi:hypothetical protein
VAQRPPGPSAPRPMAPVQARAATLSSLDSGLAIAAAVVGILAVLTTAYLAYIL